MGRPRELTEEERADLVAKGYKPVEVWVLDWDNPSVKEMIWKEVAAINEADERDGVPEFLDDANEALWDELDK